MTSKYLGFYFGLVVLASCNNLSDCEKNFIEGLGISERAYLSIQDSDIRIDEKEIISLYYSVPLNGNTEQDKIRFTKRAVKTFNACVDARKASSVNEISGCYEGIVKISNSEKLTNHQRKITVTNLIQEIRSSQSLRSGISDERLLNNFFKNNPNYKNKINLTDSRQQLVELYKSRSGVDATTSDDYIARTMARIYPELRFILEYQKVIDWDAQPKSVHTDQIKHKNTYTLKMPLIYDVNGVYYEQNNKRAYFNNEGVAKMEFTENLTEIQSTSAKISIVLQFRKKALDYKRSTKVFFDGLLIQESNHSGRLKLKTKDVNRCN